ncbi:Histone acetyltransferase MYST4 [Cricetulus griseus]|uniref:Histone acetyltransferase MYST4 n=1 Tax=Cricetulus griseus TaxID=10029 RepID=G3I6K8_CRIGR|nr:Histone acetyltransferase MYST4 [Cricetulus griseus]
MSKEQEFSVHNGSGLNVEAEKDAKKIIKQASYWKRRDQEMLSPRANRRHSSVKIQWKNMYLYYPTNWPMAEEKQKVEISKEKDNHMFLDDHEEEEKVEKASSDNEDDGDSSHKVNQVERHFPSLMIANLGYHLDTLGKNLN